MLKKWKNGAKGGEVRDIIDYNFNFLFKALKKYSQDIFVSDWIDNSISIPFSIHGVENPTVQLLIKNNDSFDIVVGGAEIDSKHNVVLSTDLPFDGRVMIK